MSSAEDLPTLEQDDQLAEPLRRVAYEAGMMLGLEATRDEQAYHRRRLTRHQYWLHGFGTLAGMRVSMNPETHENSSDHLEDLQLRVGPGVGIDGLGREVMVHESHCIRLAQWLAAQPEEKLLEGFDSDAGELWLKVTVRHKDCPVARQPVLTRKLNAGTDAVQPSRTADSVQLELIPELPPGSPEDGFTPWASHNLVDNDMPPLSGDEQQTLDDLEDSNPVAAQQLALHAQLLHSLEGDGLSTHNLAHELEDGARLLLARVRIEASDPSNTVLNPGLIHINNLVRPFLATASQLAWLARQNGNG
ncbi:hypothetical protein [Marinobacter orientalis]|uniref:Uncharacterized protein n=1 Tax=Marinobacter orientalis TaxID=1928859 RepID=A0A7Y0REX5_9GAMM|nr:hypothetical protein [Marinobacter orientalis]NMT64986.1 hypothetical protein [Marinobacter orientalis]TGX48122.1 hypothetical protein DIT72_16000 [Marinobacter orientalis]